MVEQVVLVGGVVAQTVHMDVALQIVDVAAGEVGPQPGGEGSPFVVGR